MAEAPVMAKPVMVEDRYPLGESLWNPPKSPGRPSKPLLLSPSPFSPITFLFGIDHVVTFGLLCDAAKAFNATHATDEKAAEIVPKN